MTLIELIYLARYFGVNAARDAFQAEAAKGPAAVAHLRSWYWIIQ